MLDAYYEMEKERAKAGLPPLPLTPPEVEEVCKGLESADKTNGARLRGLLENRVAPGVDPAAQVKAGWLAAVAKAAVKSPVVSRQDAVRILGTMLGGFNVDPLVEALADPAIAAAAADGPEEDRARLRPFRDRRRSGRDESPRQGRPRVVGGGGVVPVPARVPGQAHSQGLQGRRRDQHRRLLAGRPRPDPPRHPASRPVDGREALPRRQRRHEDVPRGGPPRGFRRRRRRHRFEPQVGLQLPDVAHRRGHPLRPEQEAGRRRHRRPDRPDLLQHDRGFRGPAAHGGRHQDEDRRHHHPRLRRRRHPSTPTAGRSPGSRSSRRRSRTSSGPAAVWRSSSAAS